MASNTNTTLATLDFADIKSNLIEFLKGNETFKDYNYEGSALNVLLDVLAYNTQYNSFYSNMVANEMFLDTATLRSSVVSHAKELGYTPRSAIAPSAYINVTFSGVTTASITIPIYTNFISESVDGINYNFVTTESYTVNTLNGVATFPSVKISQGVPTSLKYTVDAVNNPTAEYEISDPNIDTSTLIITVQQNSGSASFDTYNLAEDYSLLDGT
jgi:hypothetical protein